MNLTEEAFESYDDEFWRKEDAKRANGKAHHGQADSIDLAAAFSFLGDEPAAAPRELIKKLLPAYGVAVTGGQPSAGKTFMEIHKAVCLATSLPFFEHKIAERVGTAFVPAARAICYRIATITPENRLLSRPRGKPFCAQMASP
jgi:hypothetical protein